LRRDTGIVTSPVFSFPKITRGGDKVRKIWILAVVALVVVAAASAKAAKMPSGSFLNDSVTTVDQLSQQVVNDAIVAARYAKHFRMPRNSVVDFFQSNLRAAKLLADYETTVYGISGKTEAVATKRTLLKGTYVFVLKNDQPLLEASTGNPLEDHLPILLTTEPDSFAQIESANGEGAVIPGASSLPAQDGIVTRVMGTQPAELGAIAPMVAATTNAAAAMQPSIEIVSAIPISSSSAGLVRLGSVLPIVAAVGGAAALAGGGGGNRTNNDSGGIPAPVPEPSSIATLLLGASGIVLGKYRFRR
jgi:hypothetical protein